jgi:PTS system mannose-specific IIA component
MIGKLLLSHGDLARALLTAVEKISGCAAKGFSALCLDWGDNVESATAKVAQAIAELDQGEGVLVLVDMYGGTPSNVALKLRDGKRVEVVAGVNLPMALRLACAPPALGGLQEIAAWLREKGTQSIVLPKSC